MPEPVQRWLRHSGVVGKERTQFVRLKYAGTFKMDVGQPWLPVQAEKYYVVDPPSSIMVMTAKVAPALTITARDKFYQGHGNMLVKLLSLITLADQSGPDMDQSTAALWLQEICWFPDAALSEGIAWEAIDANSARATLTHPGQTVSGVFTFDEEGRLIQFEAERYRSGGGGTSLDPFLARYDAYGEFHGVRVPVRGEGIWRLSSGEEFSYIRLTEIEDIEYNNPTLWQRWVSSPADTQCL